MKIFLSWSGERSRGVAAVLKSWLPLVLQYAEPWMSDDIPAGSRWGAEIDKAVAGAEFGIVCVTSDNAGSPWLHFEAGALANAAGRAVCPLLIDVGFDALSEPLRQFQAKQLDKASMHALLHSINDRAGERRLDPQRLLHLLDVLWPALLEDLTKLGEYGGASRVPGAGEASLPPIRHTGVVRERGMDRSVSVTEIRRYLERRLSDQSARSLAESVGVQSESLRSFVAGSNLHRRTLAKLESWYWRSAS